MKKAILMLLAASLILSMTACQKETTTPSVPGEQVQEISVTDEVADAYAQLGFDRMAVTDHAVYYFRNDVETEEEQAIQRAELIFSKAMDDFHMKPDFKTAITVCYQDDSPRYDGRGTTSTLRITPDYSREVGRLTYFLSQGKLPAWLSIGLERHWLAEAGLGLAQESPVDLSQWAKATNEKALPSFSDVWFIPNLIGDELSHDKAAVAEQFVAYLDENGQLEELVAAYLDPANLKAAEALRKTAWEQATGVKATEDDGLIYQYMIDQYISSGDNGELLFSIQTDLAQYYYAQADWLTLEKINSYAKQGDSSISATEKWFNYEHAEPYTIVYMNNEGTGAVIGMRTIFETNTVSVFLTKTFEPVGLSHEIAHLVLYHSNTSNKGWYADKYDSGSVNYMEEALCPTVNVLCDSNSDDPILNERFYQYCQYVMETKWGTEYLQKYHDLVARKGRDSKRLDPQTWIDMSALKEMEALNMRETLANAESNIEFLHNFETGPSFMLYLLDGKGTKEDLIKIYQDISSFEGVYGQSLTSMIDEWLLHLETEY